MGATFSCQNDHLLSKNGIVCLVFSTLSLSKSSPQIQKKNKHRSDACVKRWRWRDFFSLKNKSFSARYSFKTSHTVTKSLSSVVSVESEDCQWLLENLKLATRFSLKWNWYMGLTKILKPDRRVLNNGQKFAGSQTNNPFDQSNLFVKASADSLWCKRCNSSKFTTLVSEDGEDGTVLFVNSRSLQNSTVKRMHAQ